MSVSLQTTRVLRVTGRPLNSSPPPPLLQNLVCEILFAPRQGQQPMDLAFLLQLRCCSREANHFANDLIRELVLAPALQVDDPHAWPKGMSTKKAERVLVLCLADVCALELGSQETERIIAAFVSSTTVLWHEKLLRSATKFNRNVLLRLLLTSSTLYAQSTLLQNLQQGHSTLVARTIRYHLLTDAVMNSSTEILGTLLGVATECDRSLSPFLPTEAVRCPTSGKTMTHLQALFKKAVEQNKPAAVRTLLLKTSLKVPPVFFNEIVSRGNVAMVKAMLDAGVDPDASCKCDFHQQSEGSKSFIRTEYLETPLLAAISSFQLSSECTSGSNRSYLEHTDYGLITRSYHERSDYGLLLTHDFPAVTNVEKLAMVRLLSMATKDVTRRARDTKIKPLLSSARNSTALHLAALIEGRGVAASVFQELLASPSLKPELLAHTGMITSEVMLLACEGGNSDVVMLLLDLGASLRRAQPRAQADAGVHALLSRAVCFSFEKLSQGSAKSLETLITGVARRPALLSQLLALKLRLTGSDKSEPDCQHLRQGNDKCLARFKAAVTHDSSGACLSLLEAACRVQAPPACLRLLVQHGAAPHAELDNEVKRMLASTTAAGSKHTQQILELLTKEGAGKDKQQLADYCRAKLLQVLAWNADQCPGRASAVAFLLRHLDCTEAVLREASSELLTSYARRKSTRGDASFAPTLWVLFARLKKDFAVEDTELLRLLSVEHRVLSLARAGKARQPPLLQALHDVASFHLLDPPMHILQCYLADAKAKLDDDAFRSFLNNRNAEGCSALDLLFTQPALVPDCFIAPLLECGELGEGNGNLILRHVRLHGGKHMDMKVAKKNVKLENVSVRLQDGKHDIHVEFLAAPASQHKVSVAVVNLGRRRGPRDRLSPEPQPEQTEGDSARTGREGRGEGPQPQHVRGAAEHNLDSNEQGPPGGGESDDARQALHGAMEGEGVTEAGEEGAEAKEAGGHGRVCCFGCGFGGEKEEVERHEGACPVRLSGSQLAAREGAVMWAPTVKWPSKSQWAVRPHLVLSGRLVDEGWASARQEVGLVLECAACSSFSCAQGHKAFSSSTTPPDAVFWSRKEDAAAEGGVCCFRLLLLKLVSNTNLVSIGLLKPSDVARLQSDLIERRWWDVLFALLAQTEGADHPLQALSSEELSDLCLHGTATMVERIASQPDADSQSGDGHGVMLFLRQRESTAGAVCSAPPPRAHYHPQAPAVRTQALSSALQDAFQCRRWPVVTTILEHVGRSARAAAALCLKVKPAEALASSARRASNLDLDSDSEGVEPTPVAAAAAQAEAALVPPVAAAATQAPVEALLDLCFGRDDTPDGVVDSLMRAIGPGLERHWTEAEILDRAARLFWGAFQAPGALVSFNWRRAERLMATGLKSPSAPHAELTRHVRALVNSKDPYGGAKPEDRFCQRQLLLRALWSPRTPRGQGPDNSVSPEQERFLEKFAQSGGIDDCGPSYWPSALRYCILTARTSALRVLLSHPECVAQAVARTAGECPACLKKLQWQRCSHAYFLCPDCRTYHERAKVPMSTLECFWRKFFEDDTEPKAELYDLLSLFLIQNRCPPTEEMLTRAPIDLKLLSVLARTCAQSNDSRLSGKLATSLRTMLHAGAGQLTEGMRVLLMVDLPPSSESPEPLFLTDTRSSLEDETILSLAVRLGNVPAATALLKHKCVSAQIDQQDNSGCAPLHRACQSLATGKDTEACVNLLLDAGADPTVCDGAGRMPGSFLRFCGGVSDLTRQRLLVCSGGPRYEVCAAQACAAVTVGSSSSKRARQAEPAIEDSQGASESRASLSTARGNPDCVSESALFGGAGQPDGKEQLSESSKRGKRARGEPSKEGESLKEEEITVRSETSTDHAHLMPENASEGQGTRKSTRTRKRKWPGA